MKRVLWFIFSTFICTFVILFIRSYFLPLAGIEPIHYIEKNYIESWKEGEDFDEWYTDSIDLELLKKKEQALKEKLREKFSQTPNIDFYYFPSSFEEMVLQYKNILTSFLESNTIKSKIKQLRVDMHEQLFDVRWKMKDKTLHFFGVLWMEEDEFLSVSIHEFAHYVDLYFLKKSVLKDVSDYFYSISWDSTKVMKPGSAQQHFVSGYAMTNKYEDFAESFTYYIVHNEDFLKKTEDSDILKQKYDFFTKNLFKQEAFMWTDFSLDEAVENYYWDITKIDFDLQKLLILLKNGI